MLTLERKIKIKFPHKNKSRCLHEIFAIIRTDRLTGRAILLTNSIKTKTGIKTGGDLGGVKFISINIKLKLKGKSLTKLYKTKQNLVYCRPNLKGFEAEYKIYI